MFSQFKKLNKNNKNQLSLYVHWPYCEAKCPYCDFNSYVNENIDVDNWITSFSNQLQTMRRELLNKNIELINLNTIFFGGGTPSLMPLEIIENIIEISNNLFSFDKNIEITLEANPSSYDEKKFIELKNLGVNRISIGVQSLNDRHLKFLGRLHNIKDVYVALEDATNIFDNVSVDLKNLQQDAKARMDAKMQAKFKLREEKRAAKKAEKARREDPNESVPVFWSRFNTKEESINKFMDDISPTSFR